MSEEKVKAIVVSSPKTYTLASAQFNVRPNEDLVRMQDLEVVGYLYEVATRIDHIQGDNGVTYGEYSGWEERSGKQVPVVPFGSVRNVRTMFASKIEKKGS